MIDGLPITDNAKKRQRPDTSSRGWQMLEKVEMGNAAAAAASASSANRFNSIDRDNKRSKLTHHTTSINHTTSAQIEPMKLIPKKTEVPIDLTVTETSATTSSNYYAQPNEYAYEDEDNEEKEKEDQDRAKDDAADEDYEDEDEYESDEEEMSESSARNQPRRRSSSRKKIPSKKSKQSSLRLSSALPGVASLKVPTVIDLMDDVEEEADPSIQHQSQCHIPNAKVTQLQSMLGVSSERCLKLLLGADFDVDRAVNHYFDSQQQKQQSESKKLFKKLVQKRAIKNQSPMLRPSASNSIRLTTSTLNSQCTGAIEICLASHQLTCHGTHYPCINCHEWVHSSVINRHEIGCKGVKSLSDQRAHLLTAGILNHRQMKALAYVDAKAKAESLAAEPKLLIRFQQLGYNEADMRRVLTYVRDETPMIIHVPLDRSIGILSDTHYRNAEERSRGGTGRAHIDKRLFGDAYVRSKAFDRVKYGCFLLTLHPHGVSSANGYGDSYFVLKNESIRSRATITSTDSMGPCSIGNCEWFAHILLTLPQRGPQGGANDQELKDVISVALGQRFQTTNKNYMYKECQYHGPIQLNRDIQSLHVAHRHHSNPAMMKLIEEFRIRTGIEIIIQEPPDPNPMANMSSLLGAEYDYEDEDDGVDDMPYY